MSNDKNRRESLLTGKSTHDGGAVERQRRQIVNSSKWQCGKNSSDSGNHSANRVRSWLAWQCRPLAACASSRRELRRLRHEIIYVQLKKWAVKQWCVCVHVWMPLLGEIYIWFFLSFSYLHQATHSRRWDVGCNQTCGWHFQPHCCTAVAAVAFNLALLRSSFCCVLFYFIYLQLFVASKNIYTCLFEYPRCWHATWYLAIYLCGVAPLLYDWHVLAMSLLKLLSPVGDFCRSLPHSFKGACFQCEV